jgi:predicted transcriptional regulator of viral defense system
MQTISTILSKSDQALIENALLSFGRIVTFDQLFSLVDGSMTRNNAKRKIALLANKGWLVRLKKGLYAIITDISTLGSNDMSEYVIAQALHQESYISFENALQYHGIFDQALTTVRSVTATYARNHTIGQAEYLFSQTKDEFYFGFTEEVIGSYRIKIAEVEKALIDMLYFRDSDYTVNIVLEKLREYTHRLDMVKLQNYAENYGISMVRLIGFLLDEVGADTTDLLAYAKTRNKGYNKLSNQADKFNAKWRLYYDTYVIA